MKVSTKRTIAGVSVAAFIAALHWAGGFDFDERGHTFEQFYQTDTYRVFLLIVAASLDGGERVPMSNIQQFRFAMDYLNNGHGLVRAVERHHGIGVSK